MVDKVIQALVRRLSHHRGQSDDCLAELLRIFAERGDWLSDDDLLALSELDYPRGEPERFEDIIRLRRDALALLRRRDEMLGPRARTGPPLPAATIDSLAQTAAGDPATATRRRVRLGWLLEQDLTAWEVVDLARLARLDVSPEDSFQATLLVRWARVELLRRGFRPPPARAPDVGVCYFTSCEVERHALQISDERIFLTGLPSIAPADLAGFTVGWRRSFSPRSCLWWGLWLAYLPGYLPALLAGAVARLLRRELPDWLGPALALAGCGALCGALLPEGRPFRFGTVPLALLGLALHGWKMARDEAPWRWSPLPRCWVLTLRTAGGRTGTWRTCDPCAMDAARRALERFEREAHFPPVDLASGGR
jgi:hypothetical protein